MALGLKRLATSGSGLAELTVLRSVAGRCGIRIMCLGLLLAVCCSCALPRPKWPPDFVKGKSWTDEVPGITPPAERAKQLRQLAKEAEKADSERRQQIARQLLEQFRQERDPLLRLEMVRVAGRCATESSVAVLQAALQDDDIDVRIAACEELGRWGGPNAVEQLQKVLENDPHGPVRLAAAKALGKTGNPQAMQALALALEEPDPALQYQAVLALRELTGKDLGNDVNRWRQYVKGELPEGDQQQSNPIERLVGRLSGWF